MKIVFDSKVVNISIHKNKYQLPNIDTLIDSISQKYMNYQTAPHEKISYRQ